MIISVTTTNRMITDAAASLLEVFSSPVLQGYPLSTCGSTCVRARLHQSAPSLRDPTAARGAFRCHAALGQCPATRPTSPMTTTTTAVTNRNAAIGLTLLSPAPVSL